MGELLKPDGQDLTEWVGHTILAAILTRAKHAEAGVEQS
jgi:hypothetical protein